MEETRQILVETASGKVELVFNQLFMALQFNGPCVEMLPYCKAMCCRLRQGYNVILQPDEVGKFEARPHAKFPGQYLLASKPETLSCHYLEDSSGSCTLHRDGGPEAKPWACRQWHCSPGGKNSDGSEPAVKDGGWFLSPLHGNLGTVERTV